MGGTTCINAKFEILVHVQASTLNSIRNKLLMTNVCVHMYGYTGKGHRQLAVGKQPDRMWPQNYYILPVLARTKSIFKIGPFYEIKSRSQPIHDRGTLRNHSISMSAMHVHASFPPQLHQTDIIYKGYRRVVGDPVVKWLNLGEGLAKAFYPKRVMWDGLPSTVFIPSSMMPRC